jgi:hypothetical protein
MKKLFSLLCTLCTYQKVFACADIKRRSLDVSANGFTTNYKVGSVSSKPNMTTFVMSNPYLFSFKNVGCAGVKGNITSTTFEYQMYPTSSCASKYNNTTSMDLRQNCGDQTWLMAVSTCNTDDQEWGSPSTIVNIRALLPPNAVGKYTIKVRYKIYYTPCLEPVCSPDDVAEFTYTFDCPPE